MLFIVNKFVVEPGMKIGFRPISPTVCTDLK